MKDYRNIVLTRTEDIGANDGKPGSVAKCLQVPNELVWLAPHIDRLQPHVVVEIGIYKAGWQYVMCPFYARGARIIGIDSMERHKWSDDDSEGKQLLEMLSRLEAAGFRTRFIQGRSDDSDIRGEVDKCLCWFTGLYEDTRIDLLHIDGAHDYESVKADWDFYSYRVRKGGLVVLHDIGTQTSQMNVKRLWEEIKAGFKCETYDQKYETYEFYEKNGIGVVVI